MMISNERIAIFRLDIALVLLLGLAGLGIWTAAERLSAVLLVGWKPDEKRYQLRNDIPSLQSRLKAAQDKLDKYRAELVEQEVGLERQGYTLATLRGVYPRLPEVFDMGEPGDVLRGYLAAAAGREATRERVGALEARLKTLLNSKGQGAPRGETLYDAEQGQLEKAELSSLESKLVGERVVLAEQTNSVEEMKRRVPALLKMPDVADTPAGVLNAYVDAQVGIRDAKLRGAALKEAVSRAADDVKQRSEALFDAERAARNRFSLDSAVFAFVRSLSTLIVASIFTGLLLALVNRMLRQSQSIATTNRRAVMWVSLATLAALFLYQTFQVASIALAGAALLGVLWFTIASARRQRPAREADLAADAAHVGPTAPATSEG
jgi:hypothetical protein